MRGHPCFDKLAHHKVGRMHIPVAPACNIACRYCHREIGSTDDRPGVAERVMTAEEALEAVGKVLAEDETIRVIGVAGPGDALANEESFKALNLIQERYPRLKKCVSTNGLMLAERAAELKEAGVSAISVTVNACRPEFGREFYRSVMLEGKVHREDAFEVLYERQAEGITAAAGFGIAVKINTVLVPEINGVHIEELAHVMRRLGACLMNIMPLKPLAEMAAYTAPSCFELEEARFKAEKHIEQFRLCKQCRADAVGIPGEHGSHEEHGLYEEHGADGERVSTLSEIFAHAPLYH